MTEINLSTVQRISAPEFSTIDAPLISVIIATYDRLSFLLQAIESVKRQTYKNWELIIVDDGSEDGTTDAIKKLHDDRIQLICLQHSGNLGMLWNTGAKKSKGEWLAFLDSDDLWLPDKLELQLQTLKKERTKWVYGEFEYVDETDKIIYRSSEKFISYSGQILEEVIMAKTGITLCSVMVETNFFNEIGGLSSLPFMRWDTEFILRMALYGKTSVTKSIVLRVRDHTGRSYRQREFPDERSVWAYKAFIKLKPEKKFKRLACRQLAFFLSEASVRRLAKGEIGIAIKQLGESLWKRDKPSHWLSALKRGIHAVCKKYFQHSAKGRETGNASAYSS